MEERNRKIYADYKNGMNTECIPANISFQIKASRGLLRMKKKISTGRGFHSLSQAGILFSSFFFSLKIGEEEVGIKLCYPVISRQIQGRRYRKNELNSSEEGGPLYDERYFLCVAEAIA